MMRFILVLLITAFISNSYAWNPFKKDELEHPTPLTPNEYSQLKVSGSDGGGNTVNIKVYNGLSGAVNCDTVTFNEGKNQSYSVKIPSEVVTTNAGVEFNSTYFAPLSINKVRVSAFNLAKVTSYSLKCTCYRNIKTKQCQ